MPSDSCQSASCAAHQQYAQRNSTTFEVKICCTFNAKFSDVYACVQVQCCHTFGLAYLQKTEDCKYQGMVSNRYEEKVALQESDRFSLH